jgi:hypothetical protein
MRFMGALLVRMSSLAGFVSLVVRDHYLKGRAVEWSPSHDLRSTGARDVLNLSA